MGSWNATCAISNLPIFSGDKIAMFLLEYCITNHGYPAESIAPKRHHAGCCYPTDIWEPIAVPVYGKYDDYGNIEEEETSTVTNHALEYCRQHAVIVEADDDDKKKEVKFEFFADLYHNYIHRDKFYVNSLGCKSPIGMMMVHRWVYDLMTETLEHRWEEDRPLSSVVKEGEDFYNYLLNREPTEREKTYGDDWWKISSLMGFATTEERKNAFFRTMGDRVSGYNNNVRRYVDLFARYGIAERRPVDDPEVKNLILEFSKFYVFDQNMIHLRRFYSPQAGAGSQDGVSALHERLLLATTTYIIAEKAKYDFEEAE